MKKIWRTEHDKIRIIWLLAFLFVTWQLTSIILIRLLVNIDQSEFALSSFLNVAVGLGVTVTVIAFQYLFNIPFAQLGIEKPNLWHINIGIVASCVIIGTIVSMSGTLIWQPQTSFDQVSLPIAIAGQIIRYIAGAFFEEMIATALLTLLSYSWFIRLRLSKHRATLLAIVLSGVVFGLLHGLAPNATIISTCNLILYGIITSIAFVYTGNIALPIIFHATWNIVQNVVFNLANSGQDSLVSLFTVEMTSNSWITGGDFGIEGSLILFVIFVLGVGAFSIRWHRDDWHINIEAF